MASYLQPELPPIAITVEDSERLERLASAAATRFPKTADFLAREIERAQVISDAQVRPGLVVMGSKVEFRDDVTGQVRQVTLVYPDEADISKGKISVLTPIGTALIGLRAGHSITWETRTGDLRRLTVLQVREPQLA